MRRDLCSEAECWELLVVVVVLYDVAHSGDGCNILVGLTGGVHVVKTPGVLRVTIGPCEVHSHGEVNLSATLDVVKEGGDSNDGDVLEYHFTGVCVF